MILRFCPECQEPVGTPQCGVKVQHYIGWLRGALSALILPFLLLVIVRPPASAQVLLVKSVDKISDVETQQLLVPSPGSAVLTIRCGGIGILFGGLAAAAEVPIAWRVDAQPAVRTTGHITRSGRIVRLELMPDHALRDALRDARNLTIRVGDEEMSRDFDFALAHDNREAFSLTADIARASRAAARLGYDHWDRALRYLHAGLDTEQLADLLRRTGIKDHDGNRPLEAWEVLPDLVQALHANRSEKSFDDAGQALFGYSWPDLKAIAALDRNAYLEMNGGMRHQLDAIAPYCKAGG